MRRYFRRNTHTESAARTLAAPLAAGILLSAAALLIIWKTGLLTAAAPRGQLDPDRPGPADVDAEGLAASPDPQPALSLPSHVTQCHFCCSLPIGTTSRQDVAPVWWDQLTAGVHGPREGSVTACPPI